MLIEPSSMKRIRQEKARFSPLESVRVRAKDPHRASPHVQQIAEPIRGAIDIVGDEAHLYDAAVSQNVILHVPLPCEL
jgi:hypothetical protein